MSIWCCAENYKYTAVLAWIIYYIINKTLTGVTIYIDTQVHCQTYSCETVLQIIVTLAWTSIGY